MSTVDKALSLLSIFTADEPQWTVEAAAERLGVPASTAYRYFRSLTSAGLISDFSAGRYVIGPAIIELDRIARRTDPLIVAAQRPMDDLKLAAPKDNVILLSRLFRTCVMCVDQRTRGNHLMSLSFERGRPMPLFRSSVSKVILANLPSRTLGRIYEDEQSAIAEAGLGGDLSEFRAALREIRRAGFYISHGEVDKGVVGISAPVCSPDGDVFASISLVVPEGTMQDDQLKRYSQHVVKTASAISAALMDFAEPSNHKFSNAAPVDPRSHFPDD